MTISIENVQAVFITYAIYIAPKKTVGENDNADKVIKLLFDLKKITLVKSFN